MKYSDLIQFDPIVTVIELKSADDNEKAKELVRSYVMSDNMADLVSTKIISQLKLEDVVDNKGVLVVGNYGTGKSHLMSVISAIAANSAYLEEAQNEKFRASAKSIAGKFEVLRIEIGSTEASLRAIITGNIEQDLARRGITYKFPDVGNITNNKDALMAMMAAFAEKYGEKGYLIIVDELLDYLKGRKDNELMQDIGFMRELGEIIKSTRLRFVSGIQEVLFENPTFHNVSNSLLKMKDRYEQALIRTEDIAYVVKQRILQKTPEQRAMIREHLTPFCPLYQSMAEQLDEYVDLFPIHPAYISTFQRMVIVEKREVLKTISETISEIINKEIPAGQPGIVSYDTYWSRIKGDPAKRVEPAVHEVLQKSGVLEDIIQRSFPKPAYKPIAQQIIAALSVHRLTTVVLDAKLGLTAQNLKDELTLFIHLPVMEEDFLLTTVETVLHDIMNTVSGQFIEYNKDNGQYFLDLKKDVDYDKKIQEKADFLGEDRLNQYFYTVMYDAADLQLTEHVTGRKIYEYRINWTEKNIFREGYLFMGLPSGRPTAQPPQDFYVYMLPLFGSKIIDEPKEDEVYFTFQNSEKFTPLLKEYAGAKEMEVMSAQGETRSTYAKRATSTLRDIRRYLEENKTVCFYISYLGTEKPVLEYLRGARMNEITVRDVISIVASKALSSYFNERYPYYPVFKKPVTKDNQATMRAEAINAIAGKATQLGQSLLESLGLLLDGKVRVENSKYAAHYLQRLKQLPEGGVLNSSDIMTSLNGQDMVDEKFRLSVIWTSVIWTALVYSGNCVLVGPDNKRYDATNVEEFIKNPSITYDFKRLEKPKAPAVQLLRRLFNIISINDGLIVNPNSWDDGWQELYKRSKALSEETFRYDKLFKGSLYLWGDQIVPTNLAEKYCREMDALRTLYNDVQSRWSTPAKLKNFDYSDEQLDNLTRGIDALAIAHTIEDFKASVQDIMQYLATAETMVGGNATLKTRFQSAKDKYLAMRDELMDVDYDTDKTDALIDELEALKKSYIDFYLEQHKLYRLDHAGLKRKQTIINGGQMSKLHQLLGIKDILSTGQYQELLNVHLNGLKACYECTATELQAAPFCSHCGYKPGDKDKPVVGKLDYIEEQLSKLVSSWTAAIFSAVDDPMLDHDKALLSKPKKKIIEELISTKQLPKNITPDFVSAVNELLSGLDSVEVDPERLEREMVSWGPVTPSDFKKKMGALIESYLVGHDEEKTRLVVKTKYKEDSGEV
ncbi:DUF6079 family protein [Syntrophomonas wolfei]|uniref:DUF6079 family protein n=1 Tax=Syntrophomonas wolfei TaxID=863 RepID=UPI000774969A|nr:DUF6079 family protein [Syntrophomonas wolfei]